MRDVLTGFASYPSRNGVEPRYRNTAVSTMSNKSPQSGGDDSDDEIPRQVPEGRNPKDGSRYIAIRTENTTIIYDTEAHEGWAQVEHDDAVDIESME